MEKKLFDELEAALKEAISVQRGEITPARITTVVENEDGTVSIEESTEGETTIKCSQ